MGRNGKFSKPEFRDFNIVYDRTNKNHSTVFSDSNRLRGKVRRVFFELNVTADKDREQVLEISEDCVLVMPTKSHGLVTVLVQYSRVIFHFTIMTNVMPEDVINIMQNVFLELEEKSFELVEYQKTEVEELVEGEIIQCLT